MKAYAIGFLAFTLALTLFTLPAFADMPSDPPPPPVYPSITSLHSGQSPYSVPVAKLTEVDGVFYAFDQAGTRLGPYTGWSRNGQRLFFCADGVKQKGWQQIGGKSYFFNRDGIMRTGSVVAGWGGGMNVYSFDENGVWNGKASLSPAWYAPKTLGDYLLDHEYPADGRVEVCIGTDFKYNKTISDFGAVMRALQANADAELLFDDYTDGDVVIMNNDIYRGTDDIIIRLVNEQGELYAPHICFSKDKAGNSYYYNGFYGFGLKLDGSVYDDILKLMKPLSEPRVSSPILVG